MCRKLILLACLVAVLGLVNLASPAVWTNDVGNADWCEDGNWDPEGVPSGTAVIDATSPNRAPIIGITCGDVSIGTITGPEPAYGQTQVMDINTSGTVQVGEWTWIEGTGTAIININGSPTITIGDEDWRGPDGGVGIVNISVTPMLLSRAILGEPMGTGPFILI